MTDAELMTKAGRHIALANEQTREALHPKSIADVPSLARRAIKNLERAQELVLTYMRKNQIEAR